MSAIDPKATRPAENDGAQRLGRELARTIVHALRTVRTHGPQNQVSTAAVAAMVQNLNRALQLDGNLELRVDDHTLHLGDVRITPPPMEQRAVDLLVSELTGRGIGALSLLGPISPEEAWHFLRVVSRYEPSDPHVYSKLVAELDQGHTVVRLSPLHRAAGDGTGPGVLPANADSTGPAFQFDWGEPTGATTAAARTKPEQSAALTRTTLAAAVSLYEANLLAVRRGEHLDPLRARQVLRALLEAAEADPAALLAIAALRPSANRAARHAVHTVIYSVSIGRRLGLSRAQLLDLALGAYWHDLGAAALSPSLLGKATGLTQEEERQAVDHTRLGARAILRGCGLSRTAYRAMLGASEHHLPFRPAAVDPAASTESSARPHLAARIIAVADAYDSLVTGRARAPLTRQQALALLLCQSGRRYDPDVLKCFAGLIGLYPIGSAVRLMSGQVGVVVRVPEDPRRCHRPTVLLPQGSPAGVRSSDGTAKPPELDLSAADQDGIFPDEIVATFELEEAELAQILA